jgi:hypothetical protein
MPRLTHQGKVTSLRVHRVLGFGPPSDHISVHAVVRLNSQPNRFMGFRLQEDQDRVVHEGWLDMLRDAFNLNHTVLVESDFDTQAGNNGVIRMVTLTKP